ncbi:MAG: glycosyltransferase family 4 protein [Pseudomonadota bacterium]
MNNIRYSIAHFVYSLATGGQEKLIRDLAIHQKKAGHQVFIFCIDHKDGQFTQQLEDKGITVTAFHKKNGFSLSLVLKIRKELKKNRIEFVHTHNHVPNFYASLASIFSVVKTVINTRHGLLLPNMSTSRQEKIFKVASFFTDRIVFVSNEARKQFLEAKIVSQKNSIYLPNGVDLKSYLANDINSQQAASNKKIFQIITVARLEEVKDLPTLIRAAKLLKKSLATHKLTIQIKFKVVGDGSLKPLLTNLIHESGLNNTVELLGERNDIADILNTCDIFLLTSKSESMPLTLIEAMASGLPIVATNVGGIPDVVDDGVTGLLTPVGDGQKIAENLEHLIFDPNKRISMGKLGRERAISYFSLKTMSEKYMELYLEPNNENFTNH